MKPNTLLPEERGTRTGKSDCRADPHRERKQKKKRHGRNNTIHTAFGDTTPTAEDGLINVQQR
jgi:hypothetical protein